MILRANGHELRDMKVRLENIITMTDSKEPSYIIVSISPDGNFQMVENGYQNSDKKQILMAIKQEKIDIIETFLIKIEEILSNERSEDYGRCAQMGLKLDPNNAFFLQRNKEAKRLTYYRWTNRWTKFVLEDLNYLVYFNIPVYRCARSK